MNRSLSVQQSINSDNHENAISQPLIYDLYPCRYKGYYFLIVLQDLSPKAQRNSEGSTQYFLLNSTSLRVPKRFRYYFLTDFHCQGLVHAPSQRLFSLECFGFRKMASNTKYYKINREDNMLNIANELQGAKQNIWKSQKITIPILAFAFLLLYSPGGGGNFNKQVTGVCHLTSEIAP